MASHLNDHKKATKKKKKNLPVNYGYYENSTVKIFDTLFHRQSIENRPTDYYCEREKANIIFSTSGKEFRAFFSCFNLFYDSLFEMGRKMVESKWTVKSVNYVNDPHLSRTLRPFTRANRVYWRRCYTFIRQSLWKTGKLYIYSLTRANIIRRDVRVL